MCASYKEHIIIHAFKILTFVKITGPMNSLLIHKYFIKVCRWPVRHYLSISFYGIETWTAMAKYKSRITAAKMKTMRRLDHVIQQRNGIAKKNRPFKWLLIVDADTKSFQHVTVFCVFTSESKLAVYIVLCLFFYCYNFITVMRKALH